MITKHKQETQFSSIMAKLNEYFPEATNITINVETSDKEKEMFSDYIKDTITHIPETNKPARVISFALGQSIIKMI